MRRVCQSLPVSDAADRDSLLLLHGLCGDGSSWNIVGLDDGYYNVDVTWDDTEGGQYDYFNKTDEVYADTHVRRELSVNLPKCEGQRYVVQ